MRHSIKPRYRIYVKGYGFMSFARSMSNKCGQKLVDKAKKSATDAIEIASKGAIQKTAEATGVSKKRSNNNNDEVELATHKKRYISPEERQQIINELRLVPNRLAPS